MPKYDIKNPTPGRRVIYDGIKDSMKAITIESGGEKIGVELSDSVAKELHDAQVNTPGSNLIVTPHPVKPEQPDQQPPKDDARDYPRSKK